MGRGDWAIPPKKTVLCCDGTRSRGSTLSLRGTQAPLRSNVRDSFTVSGFPALCAAGQLAATEGKRGEAEPGAAERTGGPRGGGSGLGGGGRAAGRGGLGEPGGKVRATPVRAHLAHPALLIGCVPGTVRAGGRRPI